MPPTPPAVHLNALLTVDRVTKIYPGDVTALRDVTLGVERGETLVLIGESGCGKTTLLRLFNRMVEPSSGRVMIDGVDASTLDPIPLRRRIGYVQQEGGLIPHWTVARNVALVPGLLGWERTRIAESVERLLDLVGLPVGEYGARFPSGLSGGQRQRVAFARSLAADPDVVLLDEPFGALDALTRLDLQREFLGLKKALGKTMVLVTHDLDEAFRLGDRIAVLKEGQVLELASPEDLERSPAPGYVSDLLLRRRELSR